MSVRDQITALDEQIAALEEQKERVIATAPVSFAELPEGMTRMYGNQRYMLVYADGSLPRYVYPLTQRPAALKLARKSGRFIWDTRENVVLDHEGNIIHRVRVSV